MNGWPKAHVEKQNSAGFHSDFHRYQVNWTPDFIEFSIDDEVVRIRLLIKQIIFIILHFKITSFSL